MHLSYFICILAVGHGRFFERRVYFLTLASSLAHAILHLAKSKRLFFLLMSSLPPSLSLLSNTCLASHTAQRGLLFSGMVWNGMVWCGNHLHPRHCSGASVFCIYRLKSACVLAFTEAILGPCEWVKSGGKGV